MSRPLISCFKCGTEANLFFVIRKSTRNREAQLLCASCIRSAPWRSADAQINRPGQPLTDQEKITLFQL